ncbi:MAG: hypothetical protein K8S23_07020 [Candidatus Cloacimonetes bacterium]|nr:hypothetical protein [Candidatus Cloacimonadota bacterium]
MTEYIQILGSFEASDIIATLALLIAIVSIIWQVFSTIYNNKKTQEANNNSLLASRQANEISDKVYSLEKKNNETNIKTGIYTLSFILERYFTAFYNLYEAGKVPNKPILKKNKVAHRQFIDECKRIEEDLHKLIQNTSFLQLLEKNPRINKIRPTLSFDIAELNNKYNNNLKFIVNFATYFYFYDLYFLLKNEYSNNDLWKNGAFSDIEKGFKILTIERPTVLPIKLL